MPHDYVTNQITPTDTEDKVASLHKSFSHVCHSSTGSIKICYSESTNTSMEDMNKNVCVSHLPAHVRMHTHTHIHTHTHTHSIVNTLETKLKKWNSA